LFGPRLSTVSKMALDRFQKSASCRRPVTDTMSGSISYGIVTTSRIVKRSRRINKADGDVANRTYGYFNYDYEKRDRANNAKVFIIAFEHHVLLARCTRRSNNGRGKHVNSIIRR